MPKTYKPTGGSYSRTAAYSDIVAACLVVCPSRVASNRSYSSSRTILPI